MKFSLFLSTDQIEEVKEMEALRSEELLAVNTSRLRHSLNTPPFRCAKPLCIEDDS